MAQPSPDFLKNAIYLVDASSYIFRAYYGLQTNLQAPDGTPTHATYGFLQMVQALFKNHKVTRCALIWDRKGKGFRHEIFPEYKAHRAIPPEDLSLQIENSREAAKLLGIPQFDCQGFEADDVIATAIHRHPEENFVVVTGDKDLLQLVTPRVWCLDTLKDKWSNVEATKEKFGVRPDQVIEVQALCGDSVDNVPGAPGVGPKTALQFIEHFGSLEAVLAAAQRLWADPEGRKKGEGPLKGKKLESVAENIEKVRLSLKLVSLSKEVPCELDPDCFKPSVVDRAHLSEWGKKMGFTRVLDSLLQTASLSQSSGTAPAAAPAGEASANESTSEGVASFEPTASSESLPPMDLDLLSIRSVGELKAALNSIKDEPVVCFDTETLGQAPWTAGNLVGFSFSGDGTVGYYAPLRHQEPTQNLPVSEALEAVREFIFIHSPKSRLVFQNAKYDLHVFRSEGLRFPEARVEDTMLVSFDLDPTQRHGMDALAQRHLEYVPMTFEQALGEERENFAQVDLDTATRYAAEDSAVTWRLWQKLSPRLEIEGVRKIYEGLDRPLVPLLQDMERDGVLLDVPVLRQISHELHPELKAKMQGALQLLRDSGVDVPEDFNLGSPKQIAWALFDQLKLPPGKKTKTGYSTDVEVLEDLSDKHPFPAQLLEVRELSKLLSTYIDALPELVDAGDSRLHTDFSQTVAVTGRLSSLKPNLQNIPIRTERGRRIREAFRAPEGKLLLGVDYSQVELRVLAHISQDVQLLRAFREGADIHRRTAALVLGKDEATVTGDDRRMAKAINFGIVYGQTAFGLAKTLGVSRGQAQAFIDEYFRTYPGIREYMDRIVDSARKLGLVRTLTGRKRPLPDIHSKNPSLRNFAERTAINSPIQGTAADLMKAAMLEVRRTVLPKHKDARLVLQIHDELLFECSPEGVEALKADVVAAMEKQDLLAPFGCEPFALKIRADAAFGPHWGALG
jgi:DNA polymerase-1